MATDTLPYPNPQSAKQYATDLDFELGATIPSAPAVAVTTAWVESESPSFPGFNGLGTELYLPGAKPDPSNNRVYDYPTLAEGLDAAKDEIEGGGPQTSADAQQFAKDVASGTATESQLVTDIYNSKWAGTSIPDTYDATTIATKLGLKAPSGAKKGGPGILGDIGGAFEDITGTGPVISSGTSVAKSTASTLAGTVGNYILKGVLTLIGGSLIFYGSTLLTGRSGARSSAGGGALGGAAATGQGEELFPAFGPEDLVAA